MTQARQVRRNTRGEISLSREEQASLNESEEGAKTGALIVLKRGIEVSPELRTGAGLTVVMALIVAAGSLAIPVLIQQILDQGPVSYTHLTLPTNREV